MKVYNGFETMETRRKYVCRGEINRSLLREIHVPDGVTIEMALNAFDEIKDKHFILVKVGSKTDPKKRRTTKFVHRFALYHAIIKGLR